MNPEAAIEPSIDRFAKAIARQCGALNRTALDYCFSHVFDLGSECRLFDGFCDAYEAERRALASDGGAIPDVP